MSISQSKDVNQREEPGDLAIKRLLSNPDPDDRARGLELLDEKKREQAFRRLRSMSRNYSWPLHGQDLAEIWQEALIEIWRNVGPERFEEERGRLAPFLDKIIFFRLLDFLRRRGRGTGDIDWQNVIDSNDKSPRECGMAKLQRMFFARFKKLSPTEKVVIEHYVDLFRRSRKVSVGALVASINKNRSEAERLSKEAVKSAKARAFRKLRGEGEQKKGGLK